MAHYNVYPLNGIRPPAVIYPPLNRSVLFVPQSGLQRNSLEWIKHASIFLSHSDLCHFVGYFRAFLTAALCEKVADTTQHNNRENGLFNDIVNTNTCIMLWRYWWLYIFSYCLLSLMGTLYFSVYWNFQNYFHI